MKPLLDVDRVTKHYVHHRGAVRRRQDVVTAVEEVSLSVRAGEAFGLAGESGSGKSTLAFMIARLLFPTSGSVYFDGINVGTARGEELQTLRREIRMVFQDPSSSFDPRLTIEKIIAQGLRRNERSDRRRRVARVRELLEMVGLAEGALRRYAHEFSGGQRQRIGIARAMAGAPRMLVLDEPVSALDVSVQAQVLNLLRALQKDFGLTYLFISHDLGVISYLCDRVAVMKAGRLVELASEQQLFSAPTHPYTIELLRASPTIDVPQKPRSEADAEGVAERSERQATASKGE